MSAFICNDTHISILALYAVKLGVKVQNCPANAVRIARILHAENVKSVNYRYQTREELDFTFKNNAPYLDKNPIEIIKAAHCLRYQSCEHPSYKKSVAHKVLQDLIEIAVDSIDGYDEAEWEISEEPVSESL